jgi:SAM-dependent methyltransferase
LDDSFGLDPEYLAPVQWSLYRTDVLPSELLSDPMYQLWTRVSGGLKWSQYFRVYRELFESRRNEPLRVLEIGVFRGASLRLWRNYFPHPETKIVGIDITPACAQYDAPEVGINVRIGSQTDKEFLSKVVEEFGPFDFIIDDGSHMSAHIIVSFNALFLRGLKDGGVYLVEDMHANYWPEWRNSRRTFYDICRELVELMHAHYRELSLREFQLPPSLRMASVDVPLISTLIREIRFFDSMVSVHKVKLEHVPISVEVG